MHICDHHLRRRRLFASFRRLYAQAPQVLRHSRTCRRRGTSHIGRTMAPLQEGSHGDNGRALWASARVGFECENFARGVGATLPGPASRRARGRHPARARDSKDAGRSGAPAYGVHSCAYAPPGGWVQIKKRRPIGNVREIPQRGIWSWRWLIKDMAIFFICM